MLSNGDIVRSAVANNTNNPNSDMNGWIFPNTFSSIEEMLLFSSPKDGMRKFTQTEQGGWFEYNSSKSSINDGIMVFNGWVRITMETCIYPEWAGAVS